MTGRAGSVTKPRAKAGQKEARRPRATVRDQADVLRVLGVLKVATATQIMQLVRPHLSDNKAIRNALLVLQADKLVVAGEGGEPGTPPGPTSKGEPHAQAEVHRRLVGGRGRDAQPGRDQAARRLRAVRARGARPPAAQRARPGPPAGPADPDQD